MRWFLLVENCVDKRVFRAELPTWIGGRWVPWPPPSPFRRSFRSTICSMGRSIIFDYSTYLSKYAYFWNTLYVNHVKCLDRAKSVFIMSQIPADRARKMGRDPLYVKATSTDDARKCGAKQRAQWRKGTNIQREAKGACRGLVFRCAIALTLAPKI